MMNRSLIQCKPYGKRIVTPDTLNWKQELDTWTQLLLSKDDTVSAGEVFEWSRSGQKALSTARIFEAIMCNVQYAQYQLHKATSCSGKQSFKLALQSAAAYAHVYNDLLPKWTFQPALDIPDHTVQDVYGHYCLARATAYKAVGTADLACTDNAKQAAYSNAAHMYMVAAHLIEGDNNTWIDNAQKCISDVLVLRGNMFLQQWDSDQDDNGACKALACYQEAQVRVPEQPDLERKVQFAYERNQVHWMPPALPPFQQMTTPKITALPAS